MNISLNTFFEFPGILILVGIVLLIAAIIIGLFAYRKVDKDDIVFSIDEDAESNSVNESVNEVTVIDEPNLVINNKQDRVNEIKEEISAPKKEEVVEPIIMPENIESIPKEVIVEPVYDTDVEEEIETL